MIDKLEMFIALAKEKHFGRAAEECRVTQPTLSAAVKQLEDQLGVMLVRRGSRFLGLTPEGQRVLEWSRRIVGDARAMREEVRAAKHGLSGHVRIAVIPTALSMISELTVPFSDTHPNVSFSILSRSSIEVLSLLENLEIDAGISYLENEPLGRMTTVPLYQEHYRLITSAASPVAKRETMGWREVSELPLCLLTPDMQNRRIINHHLHEAGISARATLESDSVIALFTHVRTGKWSSIMPLKLVEAFGAISDICAIPIVEPEASHLVGLIAAYREPHTPIIATLLQQARRVARQSGLTVKAN
jgi:DNA-binding transcriptional LysR family regulator